MTSVGIFSATGSLQAQRSYEDDVRHAHALRVEAPDTSSRPAVPARHAIYAEAWGTGMFYSINYEYKESPHFSLRAGGGYVKSASASSYSNLILMALYLTNDDGSGLEFGAGTVGVMVHDPDGSSDIGMAGALTGGFRYAPKTRGLVFRMTYTPLFYKHFDFNQHTMVHMRSMIGLSLGVVF